MKFAAHARKVYNLALVCEKHVLNSAVYAACAWDISISNGIGGMLCEALQGSACLDWSAS
jgi:hypothetical protein